MQPDHGPRSVRTLGRQDELLPLVDFDGTTSLRGSGKWCAGQTLHKIKLAPMQPHPYPSGQPHPHEHPCQARMCIKHGQGARVYGQDPPRKGVDKASEAQSSQAITSTALLPLSAVISHTPGTRQVCNTAARRAQRCRGAARQRKRILCDVNLYLKYKRTNTHPGALKATPR